MNIYLPFAIAFAAVLAIMGCEKKDDARTSVTAPPPVAQERPKTTVEATPPPPPPNAPDKAGTPLPKPGQAGDHSSPAFKAGGPPDPEKKPN